MQLVINITKKVYDRYRKAGRIKMCDIDIFEKALNNCVVLPKEHGRLIDADVLVDGMEDDYEFCEAVNATQTIIEAERRGK
jgi:hypothetical protein